MQVFVGNKNQYLASMYHFLAIFLKYPSLIHRKIQNYIDLKSLIYRISIVLLYLLPFVDIIRFVYFAFSLTTFPKSEFNASLSLMILKLYPTIIASLVVWNRHKIRECKNAFYDYMSKNDSMFDVYNYKWYKDLKILLLIIINIIMSPVLYIILPSYYHDRLYLLEDLAFPINSISKFYTCMLLFNCFTYLAMFFVACSWYRVMNIMIPQVSEEFKCLNERLRLCNDDNNKILDRNGHLIQIFNRYNDVWITLEYFNSVNKYISAVATATFIVLVYIGVNLLAKNFHSSYIYVLQLLFGGLNGTYCLQLIFEGILINYHAHQIKKNIYLMNIEDLPQGTIANLIFLLHHLSTEPIGISIGGWFVINPTSMIKIFAIIITFTIIVFQTQQLN